MQNIDFTVESPTILRLSGFDENNLQFLRRHLEYHDKKVDFEIARLRNSPWALQKLGVEGLKEELAKLRNERIKSLLFKDGVGYWTYTGLKDYLATKFEGTSSNQVEYPEHVCVPWAKVPTHSLRPYQQEALDILLARHHAGVEIGTGLGKSFIVMHLLRSLGMKSVIMAPSKNIANQLYNDFVQYLGKKYVGKYGDGKKEFNKLFTVAIDDSLVRLEKGTEAYKVLSSAKVWIADESHLVPAATLAGVCFGLMANVPYRYFFSGTQMRNDGLDLLLKAITGPIVYEMTVQQGVDQGYLATPIFRMITVESTDRYSSHDTNKMSQHHLLYNPKVIATAAEVANRCVSVLKRPTLILVKELEQFTYLLPHLRHPTSFAHAGVSKANIDQVPVAYHKSDPDELVKQFNAGKIPILVGTSCISTGTDLRAVGAIVYLVGGKSEIQVRQAVGRGTRGGVRSGVECPWSNEVKLDCIFVDFDIENIEMLHKHANVRRMIYADVCGATSKIEEVTFT